MKAAIVRVVMACALAVGLTADSTAGPSVTGRWTMAVDSPHGAMEMALTLTQDGSKVTGTFASPHGDMPVQGDFADGTLKLATEGESGITFTAKLKDKDTLTGYLSSSMGDMTFTAKRAAEK